MLGCLYVRGMYLEIFPNISSLGVLALVIVFISVVIHMKRIGLVCSDQGMVKDGTMLIRSILRINKLFLTRWNP